MYRGWNKKPYDCFKLSVCTPSFRLDDAGLGNWSMNSSRLCPVFLTAFNQSKMMQGRCCSLLVPEHHCQQKRIYWRRIIKTKQKRRWTPNENMRMLALMGVLAFVSAHVQHSVQPTIDTSGKFGKGMKTQSIGRRLGSMDVISARKASQMRNHWSIM